ncbi:MAG: hypothetical protein PHE51_11640, partial [Eubacteriales bacterium]|nr:hypothetical protein [Eubacteriales bacterium]
MKKSLSMLLVMVLIVSSLGVVAYGVDLSSITVYVTISQHGGIVNDKNNLPVAVVPVTLFGQESYTLDDLFIQAHDLYYEGGSDRGYLSYEGTWGPAIETIWGITTGYVGYQI